MKTIIRNKKDLEQHIEEHGDYNPETNYFSQDKNNECFTIFGCTYASEAFRFVSDDFTLVITDGDYSEEIKKQMDSPHPELAGFLLK